LGLGFPVKTRNAKPRKRRLFKKIQRRGARNYKAKAEI
jgi:hypothetical protein